RRPGDRSCTWPHRARIVPSARGRSHVQPPVLRSSSCLLLRLLRMAQEPTLTRVPLQVLEEMPAQARRVAVRDLHELHTDTRGGARLRRRFRRPPPGDSAVRAHRDLVPWEGKPELDLLARREGLRALDEDAPQP